VSNRNEHFAEAAGLSYQGQHAAPGRFENAPLHDLTQVFPSDIYTRPHNYGSMSPEHYESHAVASSVRGKPDAQVTVYRAVPKVHPDDAHARLTSGIQEWQKDAAHIKQHGELPDRLSMLFKTPEEGHAYAKQRIAELSNDLKSHQPMEPPKTINPGDWVTLSRGYAKRHGEGRLNGNYRILSKRVPARHVYTDGNDLNEWGYSPH
jgi:hypothetical protein